MTLEPSRAEAHRTPQLSEFSHLRVLSHWPASLSSCLSGARQLPQQGCHLALQPASKLRAECVGTSWQSLHELSPCLWAYQQVTFAGQQAELCCVAIAWCDARDCSLSEPVWQAPMLHNASLSARPPCIEGAVGTASQSFANRTAQHLPRPRWNAQLRGQQPPTSSLCHSSL